MDNTIKSKFDVEDLKYYSKILNELQYNATTWINRNNANEIELELLDTIDHLCRVSNMFKMIIEQHLEGDVVTSDPKGYIDSKISIARSSLRHYLKLKKLSYEDFE
jgi:translation initiation factor IF-1